MRMSAGQGPIFVLLAISAAFAGAAPAEDRYLEYLGIATARHSTKFLYGEHHVLLYRGDRIAERVVLYTCRDGAAFARKTVNYTDPLAPDFLLEDASNGMQEGVRTAGDARSVFFRSNRLEAEKSGTVPQVQGLVVDAGFDEYMRANWQALMGGEPLALHFLVPSRLEVIDFQAQHLRSERIDGAAAEVFRLKLSGVLGWVLPGIEVSYAVPDRLLVRFEGLSDLRDAANDNFQTAITFRLSDRRPGTEDLAAAARRVTLAACK